jgi:NAD(P)-dependent dehydrogenase (short-subunit alcohol dehydrogenase family)
MKQVLVVGGGGGLGRTLVQRLLDQEYQVIVAGRTRPPQENVRRFYEIDASSVDWLALYRIIEEDTASPVDAIIFVAGNAVFGRTSLIPLERARQTMELNFWACTNSARSAAEYWDQKGQAGKFVAILSIVARKAVPFEAYYAASKAAAGRFLECLQLEYAQRNVEFVCAYPGTLKTPFRRQAEWYGLKPADGDGGADLQKTAEAIVKLLAGSRKTRVIGWRERSLDFAERILPGLYDRVVLQPRVRRMLRQ